MFLSAFSVAFFACLLSVVISANVIVSPPYYKSTDVNATLVYVGGFGISNELYRAQAEESVRLASASGIRLTVGIPKISFNAPFALIVVDTAITGLLEELRSLGVDGTKTFYAGHSYGGVMVQEWLMSRVSNGVDDLLSEFRPAGAIFLAAVLQRKFRPDHNGSFIPHLPHMTICAELDGLMRIFRGAESFYHQQVVSSGDVLGATYPVVVIQGAAHRSFASGNPPPFVRKFDLLPEINETMARQEIAQAMVSFIKHHAATSTTTVHALEMYKTASSVFFAPIIQSLELEGSYHLKPPCSGLAPSTPRRACWKGSPWTELAQQSMGNVSGIKYTVSDSFHKVWLPSSDHYPSIHSQKCQRPDSSCLVDISTFSQNTYAVLDVFDSGLTSVSAVEIRAKMMSRQAVHASANAPNTSFHLDDTNTICKELNQHSLTWALTNAPARILQRYHKKAVELRVGDDLGPYSNGPQWIWTELQFKKVLVNGVLKVDVKSPNIRFPLDYFIRATSGFHYCKLLSPARALEWIYTDSLKIAHVEVVPLTFQ